jgi:hypothetical protein
MGTCLRMATAVTFTIYSWGPNLILSFRAKPRNLREAVRHTSRECNSLFEP